MVNADIRSKAKENRVCLWEIAVELGVSEATITRKLRTELPEKDRKSILEAINHISRQKAADK